MKKNSFIIISLICLYLFCLPFVPTQSSEWLLSGTIVLAGAIYIYELIKYREVRTNFTIGLKKTMAEPFSLLFSLLVLIMLITSFFAVSKTTAIKESIRYTYYLGIYLFVRLRVNDTKYHKIIITSAMTSGGVACIIGLIQFFKNYKLGYDLVRVLWLSRVSGPMPHPNTFAAYIIILIFPAICITLKSKNKSKIVYLLLSVMLCFNLAVTFSRNGWIGFLIGVLLLTIVVNWKWIFLYAIPAIFVFMSPTFVERLKQISDSSTNSGRLHLWQMALRVIQDNFFTGVGNGNFVKVFDRYIEKYPYLKISEPGPLPPHNSYLKIFSEVGVFAIIALLLMCGEIIRKSYTVVKKCEGYMKHFYSGFFISVVCFFIMNCFDDLLFIPKVTTYFIVFISMMYCIDTSSV